ncbi:MAG: tannase/feruloyl esterase family alpha/beta hydrolase [Pseudomonadota bacterium]
MPDPYPEARSSLWLRGVLGSLLSLSGALSIAGEARLPHGAPGAAATANTCATLANFSMPDQAVHIEQAQEIAVDSATAVPAHCLVTGTLSPRKDRAGKSYGIGFALALPAKWNGGFLFQGGGGLNGSVAPPLGAQFAGGHPALERGFAVASTDSGHRGAAFDAAFFGDQQAAIDFLYQGVARTTVVAKEIIAQHYGKRSAHAYFVGCSTGGREAMIMSQRFPDYFDGVVAGAPAMRTSFSNLGLRHATTALNRIAPRDAQGKPQTRQALSDADRQLIVRGVLEACDANDGSKDGFIFAPQDCGFDPGILQCPGRKAEGCLAAAQVEAVRTVMAGPRTETGMQVYPGYWYDTGIANMRGLPGILAGPVIPEGNVSDTAMNVEAAASTALDGRAMLGDTNAWSNLSTFRDHGGKLIFLHGVSDPWFSARDTVDYYERVRRDNMTTPVEDWSRLFLVPGMGHCGGGERTLDRVDLLGALVDWVEKSQPPDRVVATGASAPGESRPLCPYPAHAQYDRGEPREAASYRCVTAP